MMEDHELTFKDIIPQLASLYRQGLLVPFIGAGMSKGVCCGWEELLRNLADEVKIPLPAPTAENKLKPPDLIRLADDIINTLRPYKMSDQVKIYQNALLTKPRSNEIPPQTQELAKLYWPLVITTNYDDVLWKALQKRRKEGTDEYVIEILGRSPEDCHAVLQSLDEVGSPKHWAIQGFVGGQLSAVNDIVNDPLKQRELAGQIVLGHQQYQETINAAVHFRRSFAEVFRRRSLLFLGSGILEDYLINLFSEILHHQGCGPYPHFALLKRSEKEQYDNLFMQRRLGIVPIFYDQYEDIPRYLGMFSEHIKYWLNKSASSNRPLSPFIFQDEIGFKMAADSTLGTVPVKINICRTGLRLPVQTNECAVVSVGRNANLAMEGSQAISFLRKYKEKNGDNKSDSWISQDEAPSYVYRYGAEPIFAVAARRRHNTANKYDVRDLGIIPDAVCSLLREIDALGFETIHIGPIAAGKKRYWHPIHPFAQTLRGVRKFFKENKINSIKRINFYLVDPAAWSAVVTRKISVEALLTSDISTHSIQTKDANGATENFPITLKDATTLVKLLDLCKINPDSWHVSVFPLPAKKDELIPKDLVVTSTMKLVLKPIDNMDEG